MRAVASGWALGDVLAVGLLWTVRGVFAQFRRTVVRYALQMEALRSHFRSTKLFYLGMIDENVSERLFTCSCDNAGCRLDSPQRSVNP